MLANPCSQRSRCGLVTVRHVTCDEGRGAPPAALPEADWDGDGVAAVDTGALEAAHADNVSDRDSTAMREVHVREGEMRMAFRTHCRPDRSCPEAGFAQSRVRASPLGRRERRAAPGIPGGPRCVRK